jgi:ubiquinol-cytochrome c reductase cytochrome b subunit
VWYFTPYYSMLRAVTDDMVMVLIALVALAGCSPPYSAACGGIWKWAPLGGALIIAVC